MSEFASIIVQGSTRLTDLGWTTHILSALNLGWCSTILLYLIYRDKPVTWLSAVSSTLMEINPWALEILSFRFDTPYMTLSILVSILPFLFKQHLIGFALDSSIGGFLMMNAYQASSGIYFILLLTVTFRDLATIQSQYLKNYAKQFLFAAVGFISYVIGLVAYRLEMKVLPQLHGLHDVVTLDQISELPERLVTNLSVYFAQIFEDSTFIWLALALVILLSFFISILTLESKNKLAILTGGLLYIILAVVASGGIYLFLNTPTLASRPRYGYDFPLFFGIIAVFATLPMQFKPLYYAKSLAAPLLTFYMVSFSLGYASILQY